MTVSVPASTHFRKVSLEPYFTTRRAELPEPLRPPLGDTSFGDRTIRGVPFAFGPEDGNNVVLLQDKEVQVELGGASATYCIFVHAVADAPTRYLAGLADAAVDGNAIGGDVSEYSLLYEDGTMCAVPVVRRFGIQQSRIGVGASAFAAVPAVDDRVVRTVFEDLAIAGSSSHGYFDGQVRHESGRDTAMRLAFPAEMLWIYAMPNPQPAKPLAALLMRPRDETSVVYAITLTDLAEHPLRPHARRKALLRLSEGANLNAIGELDDCAIDIGTLISARAARDYDLERWLSADPLARPRLSTTSVVVEYAAHPAANLWVASRGYALDGHEPELEMLPASDRPVRVRIVDPETRSAVPARLHFHGQAGEYLPPRGHQRKVSTALFEDSFADFAVDDHQHAYVDGDCVVDLPLGSVFVEISRGFETAPMRRQVTIDESTKELIFELPRTLRWRENGWVSADTHVHFLSPQTALLEGQAEGVNVVNLLATQLGEMFSNVGDFDGRTTLGARDFGGDGEFVVRVGTENRMQVMGHISLLGYSGPMIHPLATAGPSESSIGDALEVTMADWARQCLDQHGLVVMPHSPNPQLERAADIVLELIDAIELMIQNPLASRWHETSEAFIDTYGIADWYRYLNLGYQLPLVGGSDKMSGGHLLGGMRTYTHLGDADFTYEGWMKAVRAGNTFATIGPLASLRVEGARPGGRVELPASGGTVEVEWEVESVAVPIAKVEVVVGGLVADESSPGDAVRARGRTSLTVKSSTWVALRVRGSYHGRPGEVAAHTSAVQVIVEGSPLYSEVDAGAILDQIEGAIANVDTVAPRPEAARLKQVRSTLRRAHEMLHHRGAGARHAIHEPGEAHEH